MKYIVVAVLWAGLVSSVGAMVNGSTVETAEFDQRFPWTVVVVNNANGGICGGVLVSPTWVLTAAHCTAKNKSVLYGSSVKAEAERVTAIRSIRHPSHNKPAGQNDVGLLQLARPLSMQPVRLPTSEQEQRWLRAGAPSVILGWGRLPNRQLADVLQKAEIPVSPPQLVDTLIALRADSGPCTRDSGGPLLYRAPDGDILLMGIISATAGNLCSTGGGIAFYARVTSALDFIRRHVTDLPAP